MDIPELRGQRFVGSSYGWLFSLDIELNFQLLNPFTRKFYNLPQLPPYDYNYDITTYAREASSGDITFADMQKYFVLKAILDHDPSHNSEFKVLIVYGEHYDLAFWKLGDPTWTLIADAHIWITDVIFFKEDFYAIGNRGGCNDIYLLNTGPHPIAKRVGPHVEAKDLNAFAYLADYMGELLVLQRHRDFIKMKYQITKKISIYKIDLDKEKYFRFKPMRGYSMFMGANSLCITVDSGKYPRCRKNALYLTDRPHNIIVEEYGCKDLWVYDIAEGSFSRYYDTPSHYIPNSPPIWLNPS